MLRPSRYTVDHRDAEVVMVFVVAGLFILLVASLSWWSMRHDRAPQGCCAPADPRLDLRMRAAWEDVDS